MIKLSIALLGKTFTGRVLDCWARLFMDAPTLGWELSWHRGYHPNICDGRRMLLDSASAHPYDYILCVDDDEIFTTSNVLDLVQADKDIITGLTLLEDGQAFVVMPTNIDRDWATPDNVRGKGVFPVVGCGFGFLLLRQGVLERIPLPWFPMVPAGQGYLGEDVAFCKQARQAGFQIHAHELVQLGHEKSVVLAPL
jgi:hypothetical protein